MIKECDEDLGDTQENRDDFVLECNEIEKMFFLELLNYPGKNAIFNGPFMFSVNMPKLGDVFIELVAQYQYPGPNNYRTDFTLLFPFRVLRIDIEIDGHAFHEKTKEQVTRDKKRERWLIAHGSYVLRFSGSEIYNNPKKCWQEIFNTSENLLIRARKE
jgi:hypothetical protein